MERAKGKVCIVTWAALGIGRACALRVLVNNAGIAGANRPTHEVTEAEWDRAQSVNVKGVFFCTKHAIPHIKRAGGQAACRRPNGRTRLHRLGRGLPGFERIEVRQWFGTGD